MSQNRRCAAAITALCGLAAVSSAQIGPDVIVGDLPSTAHFGAVGDIHAYSVATTSCNLGDENLTWQENTTVHPVIGQNLFRVHNGRIEQIGMSWLKHGFCALQQSICGPCTPAGLGCPSVLGVGCSDPYGATLNGQQSGLGPRFEVNPVSGAFEYPFTSPGFSGTLPRRIQVKEGELTLPGALYFVEGQYIHPEDAQAGNGNNNASYRRVTVSNDFSLATRDSTQREIPAIFAWRDHGLGANVADPDVQITNVDIPGDGRVIVAAKASDNGDGTWRYEYAIQNLNSDRCIGGFTVPRNASITVTNIGFKDIDYHSGEPFDATNWNSTLGAEDVSFNSPATFAEDPDTNALRWGTLYNFSFDANIPPVDRIATLDIFEPGTPTEVSVTVPAPGVEGPLPVLITETTPRPQIMTSGSEADFIVSVSPGDDQLVPNSVFLNYRNGDPAFTQTPLTDMGDGTYLVTIPAASCGDTPEFFVTAEGDDSGVVSFPAAGALGPFAIEIEGIGDPVVILDTLEAPDGWTVGIPSDSATTGIWEHGDPIGTGAQPEDDQSEVGTNCWFTGNGTPGGGLGEADIDGGITTLVSRQFDLSGAQDSTMSYWRWFSNNTGASAGQDVMEIEISADGTSWFPVETVGPGTDAGGGWVQHSFNPADIITLTSTVQLRFRAGDTGGGSIVEAAIDDIAITSDPCIDPSGCLCETDGSAGVDVLDLLAFLDLWFADDAGADVDGSTVVDVLDLLTFLECWFPAVGGAACP